MESQGSQSKPAIDRLKSHRIPVQVSIDRDDSFASVSPTVVKREDSYSSKSALTHSGIPRWVFIVNGQKLKQWEEVSRRLLKQLKGIKYNIYITEGMGHGVTLAEDAARSGADLIAAVGGDGTLNEVVDGVLRSGVVDTDGTTRAIITVLPLGTNSNFHRSMCWDPEDFERSMWRIGHGSLALLDVARIRCDSPDGVVDRHFINVASCGASALGALKVDKWKWLGQKMATRVASAMGFMRYNKQAVAVRIDGGNWVTLRGASVVAVGNGSYFASGLKIAPSADPYDGQLQVVTARKVGFWKYLLKEGQLRWGTHLPNQRLFESYDCSSKVEVVPLSSKGTIMTTLGQIMDGSYEDHNDSPRGVHSPARTSSTTSVDEFDVQGSSSGSTHNNNNNNNSLSLDKATSSGSDMMPSPSAGSSSTLSTANGSLTSRGAAAAAAATRSPSSAKKSATGSPGRSGSKSSISRRKYVPPQMPLSKNKSWVKSGMIPVECDGEVVGNAPFLVEILPKAVKFMI